MIDNDSGRVPSEPGSREPSPSVSAASGFDPSRGHVRRFSVSDTIADLEASDEASLAEAPFGHLALCREAASWLRDLSNERRRAEEAGAAEYAYHLRTTCACTAAQRYVETCPKHGHRWGNRTTAKNPVVASDSDGSPEGRDREAGLDGEAATARAVRHRPPPTPKGPQ